MIATSQPQEIQKIIEKYKKQHDTAEGGYLEIVLASGGSLSYQDVMSMPVTAIQRLVEIINKRTEDQKAARAKRR